VNVTTVQKLTKLIEEMEKSDGESTPKTTTTKPDNYSEGSWGEWISNFKLCAEINDAQCCNNKLFLFRQNTTDLLVVARR
jgi:hypothetical protein